MKGLDPRVKLTIENEDQETTLGNLVDVNIHYGEESERIATIYHADKEVALSIANHFCIIPSFSVALDTWKSMHNSTNLSKDDAERLIDKFESQMNEIYKSLNDA